MRPGGGQLRHSADAGSSPRVCRNECPALRTALCGHCWSACGLAVSPLGLCGAISLADFMTRSRLVPSSIPCPHATLPKQSLKLHHLGGRPPATCVC